MSSVEGGIMVIIRNKLCEVNELNKIGVRNELGK
jgi:hypothetical protein